MLHLAGSTGLFLIDRAALRANRMNAATLSICGMLLTMDSASFADAGDLDHFGKNFMI